MADKVVVETSVADLVGRAHQGPTEAQIALLEVSRLLEIVAKGGQLEWQLAEKVDKFVEQVRNPPGSKHVYTTFELTNYRDLGNLD